MSLAIVDRGNNHVVGATSFTVTPTGAVGNGSNLVLLISTSGATTGRVSSISQTGATWTKSTEVANATGVITAEIWVAHSVSGVGTNAATINLAASLTAQALMYEVTGAASSSSIDKTQTSTGDDGSGSPTTGTTAATTQANEIAIGMVAINQTNAMITPTNSFTLESDLNGSLPHFAGVYKIVSATGTQGTTLTFSIPPLSYQWAGAIVTMEAVQVGASNAASSYGF